MRFQLDVGWPMEGWHSKKAHGQRRQTGKLAPKQRERQREHRTPQQTSCPQEAAAGADAASSRLGPISSHLTWLVFISRFWQPLCLFLFFCNFYLGQRLLSCHVSPAVCTVYPGCHHRAWRRHTSGRSWTREEEEVIHKVCGPSRGSRQIEASIYKLSLSILVPSSINNILWETPTRLIRQTETFKARFLPLKLRIIKHLRPFTFLPSSTQEEGLKISH